MLRAKCPRCHEFALIIDNAYGCCGARFQNTPTDKMRIRRMSNAYGFRQKLQRHEQKKILDQQKDRCIYCEAQIPGYKWSPRTRSFIPRAIHWDHFSPFAFTGSNDAANFVASCDECNQIKSDKHFINVVAAREYIHERKRNKAAGSEVPKLPNGYHEKKTVAEVLQQQVQKHISQRIKKSGHHRVSKKQKRYRPMKGYSTRKNFIGMMLKAHKKQNA